MASLILLIVLAVYCIWLLRHMAKRRKEKHGKCVDCPYQGTGMCR
ncbi:FeoB-associated Cys-rich membrane protein [bacterium 210702-DFI.5.13]|nr:MULTISPECIES: FeoB-associated Cys-rich membrane protein [Clostridia]MCB5523701.1 FeoB-associated Cys-rich membrane protein [Blautia schinkii]MCB6588528.1 FeoB-associated Cys-rich membrane protein [bacterium 210702-DFI.5.13]MCB5383265.1 FeoB-associated Cys-rich membrane protein [Blautia glucerasea]NSD61654.1 FeoB-associated Cys-rich membrane protein [Blautia faecis]NSG89795.1 FeoB-associated Cys-rich membrane protein [Blautia faecis]